MAHRETGFIGTPDVLIRAQPRCMNMSRVLAAGSRNIRAKAKATALPPRSPVLPARALTTPAGNAFKVTTEKQKPIKVGTAPSMMRSVR